ncbi:DUF6585 family protein [Nocardia alni]|uniref:DUF6585 family protein n=1 Tax=Nocardia alni TaxID=2815723 RepID=UPI001C22D7F1|nr:DUF6585 family protein [Nocardia alni]
MTTPSTPQRGTGGTGDRRTVPLTQLAHLMAEYQKLGDHRQTFLPASMSTDAFVRGCCMVAGGLAVVAAICVTAGWWIGCVTFAILALVPVVAAGLRSRLAGPHRGARLDLFDYGITVYRSGQQIAAFRWDTVEVRQEVVRFHNSSSPTADYAFTLSGPGGAHEKFDEHQFADANEWGPAIQTAVTATQLPRAVAAIDAEETVRFGDVAVNLLEIVFGGMRYPWERVQMIDARGGLVRIKFAGRWISMAPVESIPNFYIFNEVAERLRMAAAAELAEGLLSQEVPAEGAQEAADAAEVVESQPVEPTDAEPTTAGPAETTTPESDDFAAEVESALSAAESDHEAQLSTSSGDPRSA